MVEIITQHEVFAGLNPNEISQLSTILSYKTAETNQIIWEIDDLPDQVFFLLEGVLSLHFPDNSKLELSPHDLVGEIGILNGDFRLGRLVSQEESKIISINTSCLFDPAKVSAALSLKIVRRLGKRVTNYLKSIQQTCTTEIISSGETDHIEFKSTLRWNLKSDKKDTRITHAILKTIAAFLNSDGGTLIVGVADDGSIVGLELDRFANEDKMLLFVTNIINARLGAIHMEHIHYHTEYIEDKMVLRIDVQSGTIPCYVTNDNLDHFYIRTGPATIDLRMSKLYDFIKERFR